MNRSFFETDVMGITLLILLFFQSRSINAKKSSSGILTKVILFVVISMIADIIYYYYDGVVFKGSFVLYNLFMVLYFVSTALSSYYWMCFTCYEINQTQKNNFWINILMKLPMIILITLTVFSPFTHWIFYINDKNFYMRGSLYIMQVILTYGYLISGAIFSFMQYKREILREKKRKCLNLCIYTFFPLIGGIIQAFNFGINSAMPAIVVSLIMIYLDNIKVEFSMDSLTKLYNRGQFDSYIYQKTKAYDSRRLFLVFFDIDHFKSINDTYGHLEGDNAIRIVSAALKTAFSSTNAFISRYGGDEFAVVIECDEKQVKENIELLNNILKENSRTLLYELSLSSGYAKYDDENEKTVESFIQTADKNMYINKRKTVV